MKIVYYSPHPNLNLSALSGSGTHMREIISGFRKQGHEVVTCIMGGEELVKTNNVSQPKTFKSRVKKMVPTVVWQTIKDFQLLKFDKHAFITLEEIVTKEKPDLIYERSSYLMNSGIKVSKKHGLKHILEVNAPFIEEKYSMEGSSLYTSKAKNFEKFKNNSTNRIITVSSALKTHLVNEYQCDPDKIIMIPNAVTLSKVKVDKLQSERLIKELDLSPDHIVLGFVGSIFPYHGVDRLIEGFEVLQNKLETMKLFLLIVGDGETLPELQSYVLNNRIKNIKFTGNVAHEDVYQYIDLMDITIMAKSNWYGSPVKIFEYGIMKKPIIAPDTIPVRDVIIDAVDGVIVKDDITDFTSKLENLIKNKNYRDELANSFYRKVQAEYIWSKVAVKTLDKIEVL